MNFAQRLAATVEPVERRLTDLLSDQTAGTAPDRLRGAMRSAVLTGGKRFRPFLVIESARLFDLPEQAAAETAAAIECVHCYSLVHDDLPAMDNDTLRRGQPTVWKAYDEWTAILAGDALLTLAFELLSAPQAHPDPVVRAELVLALSRASGRAGMAGGQCLDLEADKLNRPASPALPHIERLQAMKTGAIIAFSCEAGAILAGAGDEHRAALARYGACVGLAFQIADDLLDACGDAKTIGKAAGKDAAKGKATLVSLMGIEAAQQRLAEVQQEAIKALAGFGSKAGTLINAAQFAAGRNA